MATGVAREGMLRHMTDSRVRLDELSNPFAVGQLVDWRDTPQDYDRKVVDRWTAAYGPGPYLVVRTREAQLARYGSYGEPPYVHIATPLGGEQSFASTWFKRISA